MKLFQAKKLVKLIELISINFLTKKIKSEFYIDLFNFTNFSAPRHFFKFLAQCARGFCPILSKMLFYGHGFKLIIVI